MNARAGKRYANSEQEEHQGVGDEKYPRRVGSSTKKRRVN